MKELQDILAQAAVLIEMQNNFIEHLQEQLVHLRMERDHYKPCNLCRRGLDELAYENVRTVDTDGYVLMDGSRLRSE